METTKTKALRLQIQELINIGCNILLIKVEKKAQSQPLVSETQ
jgi:hypothetical protein